MTKHVCRALLLFLSISFMPAPVQAQAPDGKATGPLAKFEPFVGGQWHLDGSYQEFEWGAGRQSVRARSYFLTEGEAKLVSEGAWFWHPKDKVIKGLFTAIDMPVYLFEYTARFENDVLIANLAAYSAAGVKTAYVETWEFIDASRILWTLSRNTPEGLQQEMQGIYAKAP